MKQVIFSLMVFLMVGAISFAADVIAVSPIPEEVAEKMVAFYDSDCSLEVAHECVLVVLDCIDGIFEVTLGFENGEIADWLTVNRLEDGTLWQGEAGLIADEEAFQLYPTTMTFSDLNAWWEVSMVDSSGGTEIWNQLAAASRWSINLGKYEKAFAIDEGGLQRVRQIAKDCQAG